jgi:hypothetical protein
METHTYYPKPDDYKRFLGIVIDYLIAFLMSLIPFVGGIVGTLYILFRDGFDWSFIRHRSLGKIAMGLKVVRFIDGKADPDLKASFQRNWLLAVPSVFSIIPIIGWLFFFPLMLIVLFAEGMKVVFDPFGRRFGDEFAHTQVVDTTVATEQLKSETRKEGDVLNREGHPLQ